MRQPFRVQKISPATNYRTSTITAQIHDDAWYADTNGQSTSASGTVQQGNAGVGLPRPLMGTRAGWQRRPPVRSGGVGGHRNSDGTVEASVTVSFVSPAIAQACGLGVPLVSLAATLGAGGTLAGGQTILLCRLGGGQRGRRERAFVHRHGDHVERWEQRDALGAELRRGDHGV